MKWICLPCGVSIHDDEDEAVKCPGCKAPRDKPGTAQEGKKQRGVLMQMKAATLEIIERCKQGKAKPANGKLPISKEAQEATDKTLKLQKDLSNVEDLEYPGAKEIAQNIKAEIAKVKPKLPKSDQGLVDQAQALGALRDVREKQTMSENALKAKQQKAEESKKQDLSTCRRNCS